MEQWKDIKDYEGLYQISDKGRVKSLGNDKTRKEKTLKAGKNSNGYLNVVLCKDGKQSNKVIHRLVAEAFLPNPQNLPEVNHKDECKTNNSVSNLEWCSKKYNINYGTAIQRRSKRVDQIDKVTGEVIRQWESTMEAERNGFYNSHVAACCNGLRKTHKGFIWKYHDDKAYN